MAAALLLVLSRRMISDRRDQFCRVTGRASGLSTNSHKQMTIEKIVATLI